jgi:hypothetical protein
MAAVSTDLTHEELRMRLQYDPTTGEFKRLSQRRGSHARFENPCSLRDGYYRICVNGKVYSAHRLAWFYMTGAWPPLGTEIDHIDRVKTNNAWSNLRLSTRQQNAANLSAKRSSRSGLKGVSWNAKRCRWQASVTCGGKSHYLGLFATASEARAAYLAKASELFGEFAS